MGSNDPTRWSPDIICDCEGPILTSQEWSAEMMLHQENMIMMVDYKKQQLDNCCCQVSPPADNLN
ncbi:hypothetical protein NC652_014748 [Populus alba x Populus x berolinensis]|nr:hypothetical protein NC652_014748 [Populus alba x Populus x berolinensis]